MPTRKCDGCGQVKDVHGGKVCEKGHFLCSGCGNRIECPICGTRLR
jgi:hypothetical protein